MTVELAGTEIPLPIAQLLVAVREELRQAECDSGNPQAAAALLDRLTHAIAAMTALNSGLRGAPAEARPHLAAALSEVRDGVRSLENSVSFAAGFLERCSGRRQGGYSPAGWKSAVSTPQLAVEG